MTVPSDSTAKKLTRDQRYFWFNIGIVLILASVVFFWSALT